MRLFAVLVDCDVCVCVCVCCVAEGEWTATNAATAAAHKPLTRHLITRKICTIRYHSRPANYLYHHHHHYYYY